MYIPHHSPYKHSPMQVAVIAALCCVGHICMVGGGGGCSCMFCCIPYQLGLMLTSTFAPYILTFVPWVCGVSLSADSLLTHVMVSPSATCTDGAFSSSHCHKYCTCTQRKPWKSPQKVAQLTASHRLDHHCLFAGLNISGVCTTVSDKGLTNSW